MKDPSLHPSQSDRVSSQALDHLASLPAQSIWATTRNGLQIHGLDYGGSGHPIIIVPGITSPAATMDFIARDLRSLGRVIVPDLRGRGLSDDALDFSLESYADDVEDLLEAWDLTHPILLGHSLGARIAAAALARNDSLYLGALLLDPPMSGPSRPYPTTLETFMKQLDEAVAGTNAQEVAAWWPKWPHEELVSRSLWLPSCSRDSIIKTHQGFESERFESYWHSLPSNTVLMYGEQSPVVTDEDVSNLNAMRSDIDIVEIPRAGHMLPWDNFVDTMTQCHERMSDLLSVSDIRTQ